MSEIIGLGYLGLYAADLDAWRTYATDLLGLQEVSTRPGAEQDTLHLRMDERAWRFAIERGDGGGHAFTGWEVANPGALDALAARLEAAGVVLKEDPMLAQVRQVDRLIRCSDPDGNNLEMFCGPHVPVEPFVSPRGVRFVTGSLGLGHILHFVSDLEATKRFYFDILGFRLSDTIMFNGNRVHFAHVNPRHHSLAFVCIPDARPCLNHLMLEVDDVDVVGRTYDLAAGGMAEVTETIGRHTNDRMLSFYMKNPSGSEIEYGCDARTIDDSTWTVSNYDSTSFWGHKPPGIQAPTQAQATG